MKKLGYKNEKSKRIARAMYRAGESIKRIAQHFGMSYEMTRRVVLKIEYRYAK